MLVLEGLVGLHRTIQLQLLQHYRSGHRLGLPWFTWIYHKEKLWEEKTDQWLLEFKSRDSDHRDSMRKMFGDEECICILCGVVDILLYAFIKGLPRWVTGRESTCHCRNHRRHGFSPCIRKIPWRTEWQPALAFWPGEYHGQRSLVGYSAWCHKSIPHNWAHIKTNRAVHQGELILLFVNLKNKSRTWLATE